MLVRLQAMAENKRKHKTGTINSGELTVHN